MTLAPKPVELEIQPSRLLLAWLLIIHFSVVLMLLVSPIPLLISVGLAIMVCCGGYLCIQRWHRQGVQYLGWRDGIWMLEMNQLTGEVELQSYLIFPGIIQLVFLREGRSHHLFIFPDSVNQKAQRHLRQRLTLAGVSSSEQSRFERQN